MKISRKAPCEYLSCVLLYVFDVPSWTINKTAFILTPIRCWLPRWIEQPWFAFTLSLWCSKMFTIWKKYQSTSYNNKAIYSIPHYMYLFIDYNWSLWWLQLRHRKASLKKLKNGSKANYTHHSLLFCFSSFTMSEDIFLLRILINLALRRTAWNYIKLSQRGFLGHLYQYTYDLYFRWWRAQQVSVQHNCTCASSWFLLDGNWYFVYCYSHCGRL